MLCPVCGNDQAWVRGKQKSRQEGNWVHTAVECRKCGATTEVGLALDTHDQRTFFNNNSQVERFFS